VKIISGNGIGSFIGVTGSGVNMAKNK